jgi:hypothetical protein
MENLWALKNLSYRALLLEIFELYIWRNLSLPATMADLATGSIWTILAPHPAFHK